MKKIILVAFVVIVNFLVASCTAENESENRREKVTEYVGQNTPIQNSPPKP